MILGVYCVKDVKLDRFQPPFVCRSDEEARLIISRAGFNPLVYKDLDLFHVAVFDDEKESCFLPVVPIKRLGLISLRGDSDEV